jgi:hypothetical protein
VACNQVLLWPGCLTVLTSLLSCMLLLIEGPGHMHAMTVGPLIVTYAVQDNSTAVQCMALVKGSTRCRATKNTGVQCMQSIASLPT